MRRDWQRELDKPPPRVANPWIRRGGLIALGLAPFLLFIALLPPNTPAAPMPAGSTQASLAGEPVPLAFPFSDTDAPMAAMTAASPDPAPSPAFSPSTPRTSAPPASPPPVPAASPPARSPFTAPAAACGNGVDDDGEGGADMADPGCRSASDPTEADNPACSNGFDDDGDGNVDSADGTCSGAGGRSEAGPDPLGNGDPDEEDPGSADPDPLDDTFELEGLPS